MQSKYRRIVFISGPARSGTTLLNRMLCGGRHHRFFPECTILTSNVRTMMAHKHSSPDRFGGYFGDEQTMVEIYQQHIERMIGTLLRDEPARDFLILKDPGLLSVLPGYMELFPEARFLLTIRDPRDIVASRRDVASRKGGPFDLDSAIENVCQELTRIGYERRRNPSKVALVSYENLVGDSKKTLTALGQYLSAEFSPILDGQARTDHNPFATELSASIGATPRHVGSYSSRLTPEDAERVFAATKEQQQFCMRAPVINP